MSRCLPSPGQAAVGNEREEFISTRKHLVSFDSLHRNSGGNSNKQTGQARRGGENVKQRLNIIAAAAGEICSLLAKSLIVFFPFFFQPHLFQHQFHLSSRRLVHTTCFLLHISAAAELRGSSRVVGRDETRLGLCSINRAGRAAVIIRRLKNLLFRTPSPAGGAVIRAGEMRKARRRALHWLTMPARLCRRCP